jgi:hypothetical protein
MGVSCGDVARHVSVGLGSTGGVIVGAGGASNSGVPLPVDGSEGISIGGGGVGGM